MLHNSTNRSRIAVGDCDSIEGTEHIDKVISIDQSAIGRTPRSNPATYVGLFTPIRELFASLPDSKARGYKAGRFSFNVKGGRCEQCQGAGTKKIEDDSPPDWTLKEIMEQQYVTHAITSSLEKLTSVMRISKTYTHLAGSVAHLRTDVSGALKNGKICFRFETVLV